MIFSLSESMLRAVKIIGTQLEVQSIKVVGKNMVVYSESSFIVIDLDSDTVFKEQQGVQGIDVVSNKELYYIK